MTEGPVPKTPCDAMYIYLHVQRSCTESITRGPDTRGCSGHMTLQCLSSKLRQTTLQRHKAPLSSLFRSKTRKLVQSSFMHHSIVCFFSEEKHQNITRPGAQYRRLQIQNLCLNVLFLNWNLLTFDTTSIHPKRSYTLINKIRQWIYFKKF